MSLQLTFDTAANRNAFAAKTGYAAEESTTLAAHPSLYALAKAADGFVSAECADAMSVIVKSETAPAESESLGDGFYVISTTDFVATFEQFGGAEPVDAPVKLLSELTGTAVIDPLSADAQWARIRLSNRSRPFSTEFAVATTTRQRKPEVIVVDSGINFSHAEFAGLETEDFFKLPQCVDFSDSTGHGTAIASAAVGLNVGVMKDVKLVNVKIFETTKPTLLELGSAMNALLDRQVADPTVARVVNMSWTVPKSAYLESKINALVQAGMVVVAAAGNEGLDVAGLTPAGMPNIITVAASDADDVSAGFNDFAPADASITTNVGQTLDFFAPGVGVTLADKNGGYVKVSGTSASAGYASGCVASMMSLLTQWPQSFETILGVMIADATVGALLLDPDKFSENQNRLIHLPEGTRNLGNLDYYLGAPTAAEPTITIDSRRVVDLLVDPEQAPTYALVWDDAALEADFGQYVSIDSTTGVVTITKPEVAMPADVNIKLVRFRVSATIPSMTNTTPGLIFFAANPNFNGELNTEVVSALEDLNSVNFFAAWRAPAPNEYSTVIK